MGNTRRFGAIIAACAAMSLAAAIPTATAEGGGPTITITNDGTNYVYSPAELAAAAGQPITITNNDANGVHSVTAKDRSFNVDVPPQSSVTLTVSEAGSYPYYCQYHTDAHNTASITVS